MKVAEWKAICAKLNVLTHSRGKVDGPADKILVQSSAHAVKLIAGTTAASMVISVPQEAQPSQHLFCVGAKELLLSSKALTGKGDITLSVTDTAILLSHSAGGQYSVGRTDAKWKDFVRRPTTPQLGSTVVPSTELSHVAKVLPNHAGDWYPYNLVRSRIQPGRFEAGASDPYRQAVVRLPADTDETRVLTIRESFWKALKACENDVGIRFYENGISAVSGNVEVIGIVLGADADIPWFPFSQVEGEWTPEFLLSFDRKSLIESIKGIVSEEEPRIILDTSGRVTSFGRSNRFAVPKNMVAKWREFAQQQVLKVSDRRGLHSEYLLATLNGLDTKTVSIGWHRDQSAVIVSAEGYDNWRIGIAPIAMM